MTLVDSEKLAAGWQLLGSPAPGQLADARLQLHWAAQIPAAVAHTLTERSADDSHTSLQWVDDPGALACRPVEDGRRLAVELKTLSLVILDHRGEAGPWFMMNGGRLDAVREWAAARFHDGAALETPCHDLPEHPVQHGRPFEASDPGALAEIGRWFGNAAAAVEVLAAAVPGASPVRCWPHHFDIATLVRLDDDSADPETARSIGFGMTPGDATFPEPYFYALPWPPPAKDSLPPLAAGRWETGAFVGPFLPAADVVAAEDEAGQARVVATFLESAWSAGCQALGLSPDH